MPEILKILSLWMQDLTCSHVQIWIIKKESFVLEIVVLVFVSKKGNKGKQLYNWLVRMENKCTIYCVLQDV